MPANLWPSSAELMRFAPEIILTLVGLAIMMMEPLMGRASRTSLGVLGLGGLALALLSAVSAANNPGLAFSNLLIVDGFGSFFRILVIAIGLLVIAGSFEYLGREKANHGEYYALVLFSIVGQCVMATANDLIMIFIGLEISSIASYVLCGYLRDDRRNNESAIKYFLLGSFATAFFLYGVALVYGVTGSTNLIHVREAIERGNSGLLAGIAAAFMFVGFAFKVSSAPFQMWAPDVYQGAPAPVTAFIAAGPKVAAFAIFLRVFMTAFFSISDRWEPIIWIAALLSMTVGNFAALTQSNVKRMLAYSSIAHAGYVLVALAARSHVGTAAAMFYLAAYALMNVGSMVIIAHVCGRKEKYVQIEDLAGLAQRQPALAAIFAVFLLSLIGVPLTGGFFGKFYIFRAALESKLIWLAILGLLNSAVAAYYYLRILVVMYMKEPGEAADAVKPMPVTLAAAILVPAVGLLVLGIFPSGILDFALSSARL